MSARAAARIDTMDDSYEVIIDESEDAGEASFTVGYPCAGNIYLVTYVCDFCHSSMQSIGVAHPEFWCSDCMAKSGRRKQMVQRFELLEVTK